MKGRLTYLLICGAVLMSASFALGSGLISEVYRSPYGEPYATAVDPSDGSCWAILGLTVVHLDAEGNTLQEFAHFQRPLALAVNTADGSCWVADRNARQVIHLSREGQELWRGDYAADGLAVNATDGSVWLSNYEYDVVHAVVRLSATGEETLRVTDVAEPRTIAVNPIDGSCWVWDMEPYALKHFSSDGILLWELADAGYYLSLNASDGSLWTAGMGRLYHLSADDEILWSSTGYSEIADLAVDPATGNCWYRKSSSLGDWTCTEDLVLLSPSGTEVRRLAQGTGGRAGVLSLNSTDGSLWSRAGAAGLVHLASNGTVLWEDRGLLRPTCAAVSPADGGYWLAGAGECYGPRKAPWVARFDASGQELWRRPLPYPAHSLSLDTVDSSVWVAEDGAIGHFSSDGTPLPFSGTYEGYIRVYLALNPRDRSVWVYSAAGLEHYSAAGALLQTFTYDWSLYLGQFAPDGSLWTAGGYYDLATREWSCRLLHISPGGALTVLEDVVYPRSLSVNQRDGSVWVCDQETDLDRATPYVSHLDASGRPLWRGIEQWDDRLVAVDSRTGNCWVSGAGMGSRFGYPLYVLSPSGETLDDLGPELGYFRPLSFAVNPANGALWIADESCGYRIFSAPPFSDVAAGFWATPAILECVAAGIVGGYADGTYQPSGAVTRDQMAVFISRAVAGGEGNVPVGPGTASFADVPTTHWAFRHVEYAKAAGIVGGYPDGLYHPAEQVNRGQMAVFVSRAMAGGDAGVPPGPVTATFPDVPTDFWAYKHVEYAKANAVVGGYPDGSYRPEVVVTRDQMAVFVARAFHLL